MIVVTAFFVWICWGHPELEWVAWFVSAAAIVSCFPFALIVWQIPAYRNPVLQLRPEALIFYGIAIPWTAVTDIYVGNVNVLMQSRGVEGVFMSQDRLWIGISNRGELQPPDLSRSFMYRYARAVLARQNGKLLLPLVNERSVSDLAREVQERITERAAHGLSRFPPGC
jgi:hypothetical protein